jgi:hypothetical protein
MSGYSCRNIEDFNLLEMLKLFACVLKFVFWNIYCDSVIMNR